MGNVVSFIDSAVPEQQALISAMPIGTEVVLIDSARDGLAQMAEHLAGRTGLDSIHLISHGMPGKIQLGSGWLDGENIEAHRGELAVIGEALGEHGDLLIYGCEVAKGDAGQALVRLIAAMTRADIAASTRRVGSASLGGSWTLDATVGQVTASSIVQANLNYEHVLAPSITTATYNYTTGVLVVSCNGGLGASEPIDLTKLTFTGEGAATQVLTGTITAQASNTFTVTLSGAAKLWADLHFNKNLGTSTGGTVYNLAAAGSWVASDASGDPAGTITVSNVPVPTISTVAYNAGTGVLTVSGSGFLKYLATGPNDINATKFTFTGQGGGTFTLSAASNVEVASSTQFTITLAGADLAGVNALLNNNGTSSSGGTAYNLSAAEDWAQGADAALNIQDLTTGITVSGLADITPPTVSISNDESGTANIAGGNVVYTFQFSESVTGFDASDVTVANGTKGTFTAVDGDTYTLSVTPSSNFTGNLTVDVAANAATDTASNPSTAATQSVQAVDTAAPSLTISDDEASTANIAGGNVVYTFQFSESVTGFDASDVIVANGTKGTFTAVDGDTYTVSVTPSSNFTGNLTVDVAANAATDSASNPSTAATQSVQAVDTAAPSLTISDDEASTANIAGADVVYTFQFSESVTGFDASDVTVANGTKGTFTAVDGDTYTLSVTPSSNFTGNLTVDVAANAATDGAANGSTAATQSVQAVDTAAPSLTISDDEAGTANIAGGPVVFTFQFSETVTGFGSGDITVAGGTPGTFTAVDGDTYTLSVTPNSNSTTNITVDVGAAAAIDAASNSSTAATQAVQAVDTVAPSVTITDDEPGTANIASGDVVYTFQFSETVTTFNVTDVTVANGTKGIFTAIDGDTYTLVVTPSASFTGNTTVDVAAAAAIDAAGNPSTAATQSVQAVDTAAPTVTITDDESGTANIAGGDVLYTFQFSEAVTTFDDTDVTVANGTKGTFTAVDADTYTLVVTPAASFTGNMTVDVGAAAAIDAVSNPSTAATQSVQAVDTVAPSVTITDDESGTANIPGADVVYTFQFSETVTGFDDTDVTVVNGTKGTFTAVDGDTYTLAVTPSSSFTGNMSVDVAAAAAIDAASNPSTAVTQSVQAVDTVAPSVTITDDESGTANIVGGDVLYTFEFSETVTTFDATDVTVANGTKGTFTAIDGDTYTLLVTPDATFTGNMTVDVAAAAAIDAAGNPSTAATQSVQTVDTEKPTIISLVTFSDTVISDSDASGPYFTVSAVFSETMDTSVGSTPTVTFGTDVSSTLTLFDGVWSMTNVPFDTFTARYTVADANVEVNDVTATVGDAFDAAGNEDAPAINSFDIDTLNPSVTITDDETGTASIPGGNVVFTFQFSETVTGFGSGDVVVTGGTMAIFTAVDGDTYTLSVTPDASSTTNITVDVGAGSADDMAGNDSTAATQSVQSVDTVVPTVTITDDESGTTTGDVVTYTFEFSEPVTGFDIGDVTVVNGIKGTFTAVDGDTYTLEITPDTGILGNMTVDVAAASALDAAGNPNAAATQSVQPVDTAGDTTPPDLTITDDEPGTANIAGGDVVYTFQFSETVTGFDATDITVANGTKGTFTTVDVDTYTLAVTPSANFTGNMTVDVDADAAEDGAENGSTAATQSVQVVDTAAPSVAITDDESGTASVAGGDVVFTFQFSETVTGFGSGDITVAGGTPGTFTVVDGDTYTLSVTPNSNSTTNITVDVGAGAANDAAGNPSTAATQAVQTVDTAASVTITINNITPDNILNAVEAGGSVDVTGTVSGDADDGDDVKLMVNGVEYTGDVSGGRFSIAVPGSALAADPNTTIEATISVTDSLGNSASGSDDHFYTVDTTAPNPGILSFVNLIDTGANDTPDITSDNDFDLSLASGDGDGVVVYERSVNGGGWGSALASYIDIPDGNYKFRAKGTDTAGNVGFSNVIEVTVDTSAPTASTIITAITQDTGTAGDFSTYDSVLTVSGTNTALGANERVQVSNDGGASWDDATTDSGGGWHFDDPDTHTSNFYYRSRVIDAAGNTTGSGDVQLIQIVVPVVTNVSVSDSLITDSDDGATFTVTVDFDQPMYSSGSSDPVLVFAPNVGGSTLLFVNDGWTDSDTYWANYIINDVNTDVDNVSIDVTGASSALGLGQADYTPQNEFGIDTLNPTVLSVTASDTSVTTSDEGSTFSVVIVFSEAMNNGVAPTLTFNPTVNVIPDTLASAGGSGWSVGNTTYTAYYTVVDIGVDIGNVTIDVTGAQDAATNPQQDYTAQIEFTLDTYHLYGTDFNDLLTGNNFPDHIFGGNSLDTLIGAGGNDYLDGGLLGDSMVGGAGDDTYIVDSVSDKVVEAAGEGTDTVYSSQSYILTANVEHLFLTGTVGNSGKGNTSNNAITGNNGANLLTGLDGNDTLFGGLGNDSLTGGAGTDVLNGGTGLDLFIFDTAINATSNVDTIQDFVVADDTIRLLRGAFPTLPAGTLSSLAFVSGTDVTTASTAAHRIIYDTMSHNLYYDGDGTGGAYLPVLFANIATLTGALANTDFVVV